jgi:hypothetical protein
MVVVQNSTGKRLGPQFRNDGTPTRFTKILVKEGIALALIKQKNLLRIDLEELKKEAEKRNIPIYLPIPNLSPNFRTYSKIGEAEKARLLRKSIGIVPSTNE